MSDYLTEMQKLLGDRFELFVSLQAKPPFRGVRLNTLKTDEKTLFKALGVVLEKAPFSPLGYYLPSDFEAVGGNPLHHCGGFYVQEPSAMSAVTMLGVQRGDRVLDLCAAPGGKSTQIAQYLDGEGLLVSNEIVQSRAKILLSNIERLGVKNAVVTSCRPDVLCGALPRFFDKILVDAPCSGEGMFRKDASAESEWSYEHMLSCAERQLKILESAAQALADGGRIVYSTCTFSREENEGVIERFLSAHSEFEEEAAAEDFGEAGLGHGRRIYPFNGGEGHFAVRLRHKGCAENNPPLAWQGKRACAAAFEFYDSVFCGRPFGENLTQINSKLYAQPSGFPLLEKIPILRSGVLLGEIKQNRIEPEHCAFMAAKPEQCRSRVSLDINDKRVRAFLHGEEIPVDPSLKGYTAVCVEGVTAGFGKAVGGTLKNKYPKGLRSLL